MNTHKVIDLWNNNAITFEGSLTECTEFADTILVNGFTIVPMESLTKEYRNQVYTIMLSTILNDIAERTDYINKCRGFCGYLTHAVNTTDTDEYTKVGTDIDDDHSNNWKYIDNLNLYPELIKHQSDNGDAYWFPCNEEGAAKRVSILEEAIELTKS